MEKRFQYKTKNNVEKSKHEKIKTDNSKLCPLLLTMHKTTIQYDNYSIKIFAKSFASHQYFCLWIAVHVRLIYVYLINRFHLFVSFYFFTFVSANKYYPFQSSHATHLNTFIEYSIFDDCVTFSANTIIHTWTLNTIAKSTIVGMSNAKSDSVCQADILWFFS